MFVCARQSVSVKSNSITCAASPLYSSCIIILLNLHPSLFILSVFLKNVWPKILLLFQFLFSVCFFLFLSWRWSHRAACGWRPGTIWRKVVSGLNLYINILPINHDNYMLPFRTNKIQMTFVKVQVKIREISLWSEVKWLQSLHKKEMFLDLHL